MSSTAPAPEPAPLVMRDRDGPVVRLTLNRPRQYNAMNHAVLEALCEALDAIAGDETVRVVVLAGAGPAFCAGHDLREMRADHDRDAYRAHFDSSSTLMKRIVRLPQPVIARVHGIATAAGCQLVASCDLAVAASTARFAVSGVRLGLFCTTPGIALARNLSRKHAFEMLVTGAFIDAARAAELGLVNRVAEPEGLDQAVAELAASIVASPASAIRIGKEKFYQQIEAGLDAAYALGSEAMASNMMQADAIEGIDAFLEKRPPRW